MTKIIVYVAIAALVGGIYIKGTIDEKNRAAANQAAADRKADLERKNDDRNLENLSSYDLCVAGLRSNRMPTDLCEQLRGAGEK